MRQRRPIVTFNIECYHYPYRGRADENASKTVTFKNSSDFEYSNWVD